MLIENLIPQKILDKIEMPNFSPDAIHFSLFEKKVLRKRLNNYIKDIFLELIDVDEEKIKKDFEKIDREEFDITPFDVECCSYNLPPLNLKFIYHTLRDLYYFEILYVYTLTREFLPSFENLVTSSDKTRIENKMLLISNLEYRVKTICKGKNLMEFYDHSLTKENNDIPLLKKYISILV